MCIPKGDSVDKAYFRLKYKKVYKLLLGFLGLFTSYPLFAPASITLSSANKYLLVLR